MNLPRLIPEPWRLASRVLAVGLLLFAVYLFGRHDGAAHVQAGTMAPPMSRPNGKPTRPPRPAGRRRPKN